MNSRWLQEYSIQTTPASMQVAVILFGFMATGLILKTQGYPDIGIPIHGRTYFVRHFGPIVPFVPVIRVFATVSFEGRPDNRFTKRSTVVTGMGVLAILSYFFFTSATRALDLDLRSGRSHGVILES